MKTNQTKPARLTRSTEAQEDRHSRGFTIIELLVILAMAAFLALAFKPALAKTKPDTRAIQCQNNLRQLTAAWIIYAGDHGDRVANNFGVSETSASIQANEFQNWVNNVMSWGASSSVGDRSITNAGWLTNGVFGAYLGGALSVYKCPSDNYLSPAQAAAGWSGRLRSVSMNSVFGRFSTGSDSTARGLNWAFSQYAQYLKLTGVPRPFKTWLLTEEHPDSINDAYFVNSVDAPSWQDIPASFHNRACSFSFADGHTEMKRWHSATSWYRIQFVYPSTRPLDTLGRADFQWYLSRTGYMDAKTGQLVFGY